MKRRGVGGSCGWWLELIGRYGRLIGCRFVWFDSEVAKTVWVLNCVVEASRNIDSLMNDK